MGYYLPGVINIAGFCLVYGIAIFLNKKEIRAASKIILLVTVNFHILLIELFFTGDEGIMLFLMPITLFYFVILNNNEWIKRGVMFVVSLTGIYLSIKHPLLFGEPIQVENSIAELIYWLAFLSCLVLVH